MKIVFKDYTFDSTPLSDMTKLVYHKTRGVYYHLYGLRPSEAYATLELLDYLKSVTPDITIDQLAECLMELVKNGAIYKNS